MSCSSLPEGNSATAVPTFPGATEAPFGNAGICAIAFAFVPPELISTAQRSGYVAVVGLGFALFSILPFVLYSLRRPEWRSSLDPKT